MELTTVQLWAAIFLFVISILAPVGLLTYLYISRGSWKHVAAVVVYAFLFGSSFPGGVYLYKLGLVPWHPYVYVGFVWLVLSLVNIKFVEPALGDD